MFLRKKKKQNGIDKDLKTNGSNGGRSSIDEEVEVDAEGYTIRKPHDPSENGHKQLDKFYSSSESDDSDTETEKKLHFEIKPRNGTLKSEPSLAELKETVKQLSISSLHGTRRQLSTNSATGTTDDASNRQSIRSASNTSTSLASTFNGSLSSLSVLAAGQTDPLNSTAIHEIPRPHSTHANLFDRPTGPSASSIISPPSSQNAFSNGHSFTVGAPPTQQDRYAALRDIFDDVNTQWSSTNGTAKDNAIPKEATLLDQNSNGSSSTSDVMGESQTATQQTGNSNDSSPLIKSLNLSKSISSFSIMGPPTSVPLQANHSNQLNSNRKAMQLVRNGNGFTTNMPRCESYSSLSLEMRMTPVSLGSSRGPSPLTANGVIPIAIAIQESISARFKGSDESKCNSVIYGDLKIAFPAGILQTLNNSPTLATLRFKLTNASKITKVLCNKDLIVEIDTQDANNNPGAENYSSLQQSERSFEFRSAGLIQALRKSYEQAPFARYYNVDVLKYQLARSVGASACPLQVVTHWKCELQSTCLKIDYKYNANALSSIEPLSNVTFTANVNAQVVDWQSKPNAYWNSDTKQITWNVDKISRQSDQFGLGSLRAKFNIVNGPTSPQPVVVQMACKNTSFSGLNVEPSAGYRVSLFKKQIMTGRYISEADSTINYACV